MGIFKIAFDFILLVLGLAYMADAGSLLIDVKNLAAKDAHPHKYLSLKKWTKALTE